MANVILLVASALAPSAGHEAVMCPHTSCYFDYTQCLRDDPALYPWFTHPLPPRRVRRQLRPARLTR